MIIVTILRFAAAVIADTRALQRTIRQRYPFLAE